MLTLHHLNDSRSQRILWLLEELGTPYEMKRYQRDATTRLAPPKLKKIHPLGKSPIITDGETTIAESAAIVGFTSAIAAYGAFFIPRAFGMSISSTGSPMAALYGFILFYASCAALTWWAYTRKGSLLHDIERGRAPTAPIAQGAPA